MGIVLALVKYAGKNVSPANVISPTRVALVTAGNDDSGLELTQDLVSSLADQLAEVDGITPVVVGTLITNLDDSLRDVRFNYQAGSIVRVTTQLLDTGTRVTLALIAPGGYEVVWTRTETFEHWDDASADAADSIAAIVLSFVQER